MNYLLNELTQKKELKSLKFDTVNLNSVFYLKTN